jgi:hypothetical protein
LLRSFDVAHQQINMMNLCQVEFLFHLKSALVYVTQFRVGSFALRQCKTTVTHHRLCLAAFLPYVASCLIGFKRTAQ